MCRRPPGFSPLGNEEGFTLVEVLVALALLGTLVLMVWAASFTGGRTLEKISSGIRCNVELLAIDSAVRSSAQRVRIPYWLVGPSTADSGRALSVHWLDGREDKSLTLSFQNGALIIDDGGTPAFFPGAADARMEVSPPAQGAAPALILTVRFAENEPVRIIAPFGASAFPVVGQH